MWARGTSRWDADMARIETSGGARGGKIDLAAGEADILQLPVAEPGEVALYLSAPAPALPCIPISIEQSGCAPYPCGLRRADGIKRRAHRCIS
jgi:hypothetical protein